MFTENQPPFTDNDLLIANIRLLLDQNLADAAIERIDEIHAILDDSMSKKYKKAFRNAVSQYQTTGRTSMMDSLKTKIQSNLPLVMGKELTPCEAAEYEKRENGHTTDNGSKPNYNNTNPLEL